MGRIESHVHVWTITDPAYPMAQGNDSTFTPERDATPDALFKAQAEIGGVDWTVLIQPRYYMYDNSYLAQAALDYPNKFVVAGRVDPLHRDAAQHLRELMQRPGYRGIRLSPNSNPAVRWLDSATQDPLWEAAAETNATMGLLIDWYQLPQAEAMAERHPTTTIVIDHVGRPDYNDISTLDNLIAMAEKPNVYVKLSGYQGRVINDKPHGLAYQCAERMYRAYGRERVMWGTDWPVCLNSVSYQQAFEIAWSSSFLTEADRAWVFEHTARKAWRIPA